MAEIILKDVSLLLPVSGGLVDKKLEGSVGCPIVRNGSKDYVKTLDNCSLKIKSGEHVALTGPNGAGKTNLIKTIANIYQPTSGEINVSGSLITLLSPGAGFSGDLAVRENVLIRGRLMGLTKLQSMRFVEEVERYCDLGSYFNFPYKKLSNGMKARVGYASSLSARPDIMLFDEWVSHTDKKFLDDTFNLKNEFLKAVSILIFCSHNEAVIQANANRRIELLNGQIVSDNKI